MRSPLHSMIAVAATVLVLPSAARAQTLSTGLYTTWTGAPNIDRAVGIELTVESAHMPLRVFAAFEIGGSDGFGVPCQRALAEFCTPEALDHSTNQVTLGVGWLFRFVDDGEWRAGVGPELFLTRVAGSTRGVVSDRLIATNTIMQGMGAGLGVTWLPPASVWSVHLRSGLRGRMSLVNLDCEDCYTAFDEGFLQAEFGLSVGYRFND